MLVDHDCVKEVLFCREIVIQGCLRHCRLSGNIPHGHLGESEVGKLPAGSVEDHELCLGALFPGGSHLHVSTVWIETSKYRKRFIQSQSLFTHAIKPQLKCSTFRVSYYNQCHWTLLFWSGLFILSLNLNKPSETSQIMPE